MNFYIMNFARCFFFKLCYFYDGHSCFYDSFNQNGKLELKNKPKIF